MMDPESTRIGRAAASRDGHLSLRRVERQQAIVERLHAAHGGRLHLADLADALGVAARTVARDVERLRLSGVPIDVAPGRGGGVSLPRVAQVRPITFDLPEIAALMSSLTTLGPSATVSAAAAMRKLTEAISLEAVGPDLPRA